MTEIIVICMAFTAINLVLAWAINSREKLWAIERRERAAERQLLLDRIQARDLPEYKAFVVPEVKQDRDPEAKKEELIPV